MEVDRNLYLTADRSRCVEEGDPDAVHLYAAPGGYVDPAELERYGVAATKPRRKTKES